MGGGKHCKEDVEGCTFSTHAIFLESPAHLPSLRIKKCPRPGRTPQVVRKVRLLSTPKIEEEQRTVWQRSLGYEMSRLQLILATVSQVTVSPKDREETFAEGMLGPTKECCTVVSNGWIRVEQERVLDGDTSDGTRRVAFQRFLPAPKGLFGLRSVEV